MGTSTIVTSGVVTALTVAGLTVALAGAMAQQPAQDEGSEDVTVTTLAASLASSSDGEMPVQLAAAETKGDSESSGRTPARRSDRRAADEKLRAKHDVTDFKERSTGEEEILAALEDPTQIEFIEVALHDVVDYLKDLHGIEIQLHMKAMEDAGISRDTLITRHLTGIPLRSVLRLVLKDLDLTYMVRDGFLEITTRKVADAHMETHVYSVHRLADFDSDELAEVIQITIRPDTWRTGTSSDKPSSSSPAKVPKTPRLAAIDVLPGCLVITQSQRAHEQITDLLMQLERYETSVKMLRKVSDD